MKLNTFAVIATTSLIKPHIKDKKEKYNAVFSLYINLN